MDLRSAKRRNPQGSAAGWNVGTETEDAVQVTQWLLWVPRPGLPRGASLQRATGGLPTVLCGTPLWTAALVGSMGKILGGYAPLPGQPAANG